MINGPHSARKPPRPTISSDSAPVMWAPGCVGPIRRAASAGNARFAAEGGPSATVSGVAAPEGTIPEAAAASRRKSPGEPSPGRRSPKQRGPRWATSGAMASGTVGVAAAGFAAFSAVFFLALPSPLLPPAPAVFFAAFFTTFFAAFFAVFFATFLAAFFEVALTPVRTTDPGVSSPGVSRRVADGVVVDHRSRSPCRWSLRRRRPAGIRLPDGPVRDRAPDRWSRRRADERASPPSSGRMLPRRILPPYHAGIVEMPGALVRVASRGRDGRPALP